MEVFAWPFHIIHILMTICHFYNCMVIHSTLKVRRSMVCLFELLWRRLLGVWPRLSPRFWRFRCGRICWLVWCRGGLCSTRGVFLNPTSIGMLCSRSRSHWSSSYYRSLSLSYPASHLNSHTTWQYITFMKLSHKMLIYSPQYMDYG